MAVGSSFNRRNPLVPVTPPARSPESSDEFESLTDDDGDDRMADDAAFVPDTTPEGLEADGTTMMRAISVEDYKCKSVIKGSLVAESSRYGVNRAVIDFSWGEGTLGVPRVVIDLTGDNSDDETQIQEVMPAPAPARIKSECSNSKAVCKDVEDAMEISVSSFICEICCDAKPMSDIFRIKACKHSYCSDCVSKFVASKLQQNFSQINCPVSGCAGVLEPHNCRSILPPQVFDRWGDALCEALLLASEKFYCPFKDCSALLIDEKMEVVESECPECHRLFCAKCKVPWHAGIACSEFQKLHESEREKDDILLVNVANEKQWMRCPDCRVYVERVSGCPFVMCRLDHLSSVCVLIIFIHLIDYNMFRPSLHFA
nr:probable E3 ubiquitin-protein ligase RNF144A-B [Ipomoea batatas]